MFLSPFEKENVLNIFLYFYKACSKMCVFSLNKIKETQYSYTYFLYPQNLTTVQKIVMPSFL